MRYYVSAMTKPKTLPFASSYSNMLRPTRRPTVSISTFENHRIQETILGIFRRFDCDSMDMEALIHFVLHGFNVTPSTYEEMQKTVKAHILKNFAIHQGSNLRLSDVSMRRVTVCHTIEKDQE